MTPESLRSRLATNDPLLGAWTMLREPLAAEVASAAGYDYVCIDSQHGLHDFRSIVDQLTAIIAGGSALPVVRVLRNEPGLIGAMLDAGALGVIVPMVNTVEEAKMVVHSCRYAPVGYRSLGPAGAGTRYGPQYVAGANENVAAIPMIETAEAVANVEAIADIPGVDALYVGPADLSLTLGLAPGLDNDDDRFNDSLAKIVAACEKSGVIPGIHADASLVAKRKEQGFRMITVGTDLGSMAAGLHRSLAEGRKG